MAIDPRRLAARPRLPEEEEVVGRPWVVRLQADRGHADLEPPGRRPTGGHHGHRAHRVAVLRGADTSRYRWQADLLRLGRGCGLRAGGALTSARGSGLGARG